MSDQHHNSAIPHDGRDIPAQTDVDESVSRAAIYARTSTSKSGFHYSIDEQVSRCWEHCQQHGWDVVFVFTDEAESGTNTDRSGFKEMLANAQSGHFDVVVFWKVDRSADRLQILSRLKSSSMSPMLHSRV